MQSEGARLIQWAQSRLGLWKCTVQRGRLERGHKRKNEINTASTKKGTPATALLRQMGVVEADGWRHFS